MNNIDACPFTALRRRFAAAAAFVLAVAALAAPCRAEPVKEERIAVRSVTVEHVRIRSKRSFDEVKAALEARLRSVDRARLAQLVRKGDTATARAELEKAAAPPA